MESTVKRAYTGFERWTLRRASEMRAMMRGRPRIIFIHVPKTAGTTVRAHLRACLGSNASGMAVRIHNAPIGPAPDQSAYAEGRSARLVHGHLCWNSVSQLDPSSAFTFTFLRSPQARLKSFYSMIANYPEGVRSERLKAIACACKGLSAAQIAHSRSPIILSYADNYMVRQFAGSVAEYPVPESQWPALLDRAVNNIRSVNFIGRQEAFEEDFAKLLSILNLPSQKPLTLNKGGSARSRIELDPTLYKWDEQLFRAVFAAPS